MYLNGSFIPGKDNKLQILSFEKHVPHLMLLGISIPNHWEIMHTSEARQTGQWWNEICWRTVRIDGAASAHSWPSALKRVE